MRQTALRQCDGCTMCCTVLRAITPPGAACEHECTVGCAIYADRPTICRGFECAWLQGIVPDEYKPDKCGCMFKVQTSHTPDGEVIALFAFGTIPDSLIDDLPAGVVVVDEDGTSHGRGEDIARYEAPQQMVSRLRKLVRRNRAPSTKVRI